MEDKKVPKINYHTEDYDYLANSATGMDCTGLMHRSPLNDEEMASYQQVYQYLPPNVKIDEYSLQKENDWYKILNKKTNR